jgi:hypothetical protein
LNKPDVSGEIAKELAPDLAPWAGTVKTNAILADIYDMLALINANICAIGSRKQARKPKPYERPGDNRKQHIGRNALPIPELRAFFDRKREERKKRKQQEVNSHD